MPSSLMASIFPNILNIRIIFNSKDNMVFSINFLMIMDTYKKVEAMVDFITYGST